MKKTIYILFVMAFMTCCKKEWLEEKNDISKIVPSTLSDMKLLLNQTIMNMSYLTIGELSADDLVLNTAAFNSAAVTERNAYTFQADIYAGSTGILQWNNPYATVFACNVALEGLENLKPGSASAAERADVKGRALFSRSRAFYELLISYSKPYNSTSASTDPGIPLRLKSDIYAQTVRPSVSECYGQVIRDLSEAASLMKDLPSVKTEPSRAAALALLARVYLSMNDYDKAYNSSNAALKLYNTLIDYNTLTVSTSNPFKALNNETIFFSRQALLSSVNSSTVNTALISSYATGDLRKGLFFRTNTDGTSAFKGSYSGSTLLFGGLSVNELYLTRAECLARQGKITEAMADLNTLLIKRYKTGTFQPLTAATPEQALTTVLLERRKELAFTTMRWQDLRRLNADSRFQVTVKHTVNGQDYLLPPNSPRYVFPIPDYITGTTGIPQNQR